VFGTPADISEHLIPQPSVRLVTFTGPIPGGEKLAELAGRHMRPAIMKLGGHAPVIVCDDVHPVSNATTSVVGKTRNAGQVCVSPTRFFVAKAIDDCFTAACAEKASAVKIGDGLVATSQMGPLANHRRVEAMQAFVADTMAKGARLTGGDRLGNRRYFFPLTVLAEIPEEAQAMQQEPFGPV
jgi:succinate-semialdehyde dehydrogenase / glutarate-semialdehyde dehydrogenase